MRVLGGTTDPLLPVWLMIVVITLAAMAGTAGLGVVIERFAYRPLRDAPRIAPLISALGVSFFLANSMQLLFGATPRNYDTFGFGNGELYLKGVHIGNVTVPLLRIITILAAFVLMILLWILVNRTRTGRAMRATSFDREAAAMMGIDIDRVSSPSCSALRWRRGRRDVRCASDQRRDRLHRRPEEASSPP